MEAINLSNHLDLFTKAKARGKYECPICNNPKLSINIKSGAYNCYFDESHEHRAEIYKWVLGQLGLDKQDTPKKQITKHYKRPTKQPIPLPHLNLATVANPEILTNKFKPSKLDKDAPKGTTYQINTNYWYLREKNNSIWKQKKEYFSANDRLKKTFNWFSNGRKGKSYQVKPYCYSEAQENGKNAIVTVVEGEKDVDTLRSQGICAISFDSPLPEELKGIDCDGFLIIGDNDQAGDNKLNKVVNLCTELEIPHLSIPITELWENAPEKADITDYKNFIGDAFPNHFKKELKIIFDELKLDKKLQLPQPEIDEIKPGTPSGHEDALFTEKALQDLYHGDKWISINGDLYHFNGKYYEKCSEFTEKKKISQWCLAFNGKKYATKNAVNSIWDWVILSYAIDPSKINPPGLNLLNGVLRITWENNKPSWKLHPHNSKEIYTYCSEIEFNPDAPSEECDRLLSCLSEGQQQIFLKTLAASFDLENLRKHQGRDIKAIICKGYGSNGKDAIRESVRILFGHALTNISFSDFQAYEQGRKFPLAKLHGSLISWSSENASLSRLDSLQSVKSAITGETIDIEQKNQPEFSINPQSIFFFNCNEAPNFKSGLEAVRSRWAILSFDKTFKKNADPSKGEIEADPRFRYDPDFMKKNVVPALLNKMLNALVDLAANGIDYDSIDDAMESVKRESNHIYDFCQESGINYQVDGKIYCLDLWEKLKQWYIRNGVLVISKNDSGKEKQDWIDQAQRGDRNIKGANQIYKRFAEIFPKIKREVDWSEERKGQVYLAGIGFSDEPQIHQDKLPEGLTVEGLLRLINQLEPEKKDELISHLSFEKEEIEGDDQKQFSIVQVLEETEANNGFWDTLKYQDGLLDELEWDIEKRKAFLIEKFGVKSRHFLKDEEVIELSKFLEDTLNEKRKNQANENFVNLENLIESEQNKPQLSDLNLPHEKQINDAVFYEVTKAGLLRVNIGFSSKQRADKTAKKFLKNLDTWNKNYSVVRSDSLVYKEFLKTSYSYELLITSPIPIAAIPLVELFAQTNILY